eukprot:SAG22_NODE_2331_length_2707_cov_2.206288_3_plen_208_part_00
MLHFAAGEQSAHVEQVWRLCLQFPHLESLDVSGHRQLSTLDHRGLASCACLTSIRARGCVGLKDIAAIGLAKNLLQLDLGGCRGLTVDAIAAGLRVWRHTAEATAAGGGGAPCAQPRKLSISGQRGLQSLQQLAGGLAGLASLDVSVARNLSSLDGLQECADTLVSLNVRECRQLPSLHPLGCCSQLESLLATGACAGLTDRSRPPY